MWKKTGLVTPASPANAIDAYDEIELASPALECDATTETTMKIIPLHHIPMRPEYKSPFSAGCIVEGGRLLFFSGCGPIPVYHKHPHDRIAEDKWLSGGMREQTLRTFDNIAAILKAANGDFSSVLKLNIYLTDMSQQNVFNEISARYFDPKNPPARTLVGVPVLSHSKMLIEVEGVAAVPVPRAGRTAMAKAPRRRRA